MINGPLFLSVHCVGLIVENIDLMPHLGFILQFLHTIVFLYYYDNGNKKIIYFFIIVFLCIT